MQHQFTNALGLLVKKIDADTVVVTSFSNADEAKGVAADSIIWLRRPCNATRTVVKERIRNSQDPNEVFMCSHVKS